MGAVSAATDDPAGDDAPGGPSGAPAGPLGAELRALLDALLERAGTATASAAAAATDPAPSHPAAGRRSWTDPTGPPGTDCGWCPVCALAAALRGERLELTRRLVDQGAGLAATLRTLLEHDHAAAPGPTAPPAPPPAPRVQRIAVRTADGPGR